MICPCYKQAAPPTLEMVMEGAHLGEIEAAILRAVWRGKGHPVPTDRILQALQEPDAHDGPSRTDPAVKFKFGLHRLRRKVAVSGVAIENCGYARGYRVVFPAGRASGEAGA